MKNLLVTYDAHRIYFEDTTMCTSKEQSHVLIPTWDKHHTIKFCLRRFGGVLMVIQASHVDEAIFWDQCFGDYDS